MKTYLVGGAVRDKLLGRPVADRDWVVVGADAEAMTAAGFRPVGKDFPVFLHPETHEEYALARTERKTGKGYRGFAFYAAADVTLEEDLQRRDLTINAMAEDAEGNLVDPYGGAGDLKRGLLRHVGPAFAEDPVRILRTARFAARYGFAVAPETMALMRDMVAAGEADALVPERVWQELAKGLMEPRPDLMLQVLGESGALPVLLPEMAGVDVGEIGKLLHTAAQEGFTLEERFALWMLQIFGSGTDSVRRVADTAVKLRVPKSCSDAAALAVRFAGSMCESNKLSADAIFIVFQAADVFRRPQRFDSLLRVVGVSSVKTLEETGEWKTGWQRLRSAVMQPDAAKIARAAVPPSAAAEAVRRARLEVLQAALPAAANAKKEK